ncbi:sigma-70 family RNA polymerase sigma factor [Streptomyces sp. Go40/10]|uniref:sigma-70 family RNA polymerase sigma factor n=1 Tax=Streptomyces sp. Go40/10 TaxID=2825844 RepID=UPI001E52BCE1|nr:sigma-70 family RNA polymerase sigma factor [Streptomyces sp. Go40/10]UFR07083.1 sigma-70 family RNA polymerase sigma factor [Streptomyces sp. Go40/10]
MMPPDPSQPPPGRPGRKLGPIVASAGSVHRAWLNPMRDAYFASGRTLGDLSVEVPLAKSKLSELLRGASLYPRWEIVSRLATLLGLPQVPLGRLWRQAALDAHKSREWVDRSSDNTALTTTHAAPPLDHRAFCEHVEPDYLLYAQAFIPDDHEGAVSDTFDILWLSWNDALASPDTRRYAWTVLRGTVMSRTPHIDGRPCFSQAAFDTVALTYLADAEARTRQLSETIALFQVISQLPPTQFDVIALRILWRLSTERVSELLGLAPAMVRSSQRHAEHYLKSTLYPPETDEGTTP